MLYIFVWLFSENFISLHLRFRKIQMGTGIYSEQIDFDILYKINEIPITKKMINLVEAVEAP